MGWTSWRSVDFVADDPYAVFINYRHQDTAWAANALFGVLSDTIGSSKVFLDSRSIALGDVFPRTLLDGVRKCAVFVVFVGLHWSYDRLTDSGDWVRVEILAAEAAGKRIIPVLVDEARLEKRLLPPKLKFLADLQHAVIRHESFDRDLAALVTKIEGHLPTGWTRAGSGSSEGVEITRSALGAFLRQALPSSQQLSGNRDRLVELVMAVLSSSDRLRYLAPGRLPGKAAGSATVLVAASGLVVVEVDERFSIPVSGVVRLPVSSVEWVELRLRRRLWLPTADVVVRTTANDTLEVLGLFRSQAQALTDELRR